MQLAIYASYKKLPFATTVGQLNKCKFVEHVTLIQI